MDIDKNLNKLPKLHIIDMEYYIYHIPGVKIGMTNDLQRRMAAQGFTEWEILETHTDGWLGGDRELELQAEYGYSVDDCHYMVSVQNRRKFTKEDTIKGIVARNKNQRLITFEQAQEIRANYIPKYGAMVKIAKEYNVNKSVIFDILHNKTYTEL